MAIKGMTIGTDTQTLGASTKPKDDKPDAMIWVNVGFTTTDPETGEDIFIGLPMGIPLDTMKVRSPGSSKVMQAKVALREMLMKLATGFAPGEEHIIEDLQVQMRRVSEREDASADNNDLIGAMSALSFAQPKAA